jgi:hypothetical protein
MGVRVEDIVATTDKDTGSGILTRSVHVRQDEVYSAAEWSAVRTAAATSLAALDAWYAGLQDVPRRTWWAGLPTATREQLRQAVLTLAP